MTGRELALLLGPLVGAARRDDLRPLAQGRTDEIAIRYDEVRDWTRFAAVLCMKGVEYRDGQEFILLMVC